MKKVYTLFLLFVLSFVNAQIDLPQEITRPTPSVASFVTYNEVPVDLFTGTPDINIPFYTLPTRSKDIKIPIGISYHPQNINILDKASDVGLGWTLFYGGVVTRTIMDYRPDEVYKKWFSAYSGVPPHFNDIYFFNVFGLSGSFILDYNSTTNSFSAKIRETNAVVKIEVNVDLNTHDVNSFVIYDDKGYKYLFDLYDINVQNFDYITSKHHVITPSNPTNSTITTYRSSHHLTKIFDNNGKELVNFTYTGFNTNTTGAFHYDNVMHKINEIIVPGYGKAIFDFAIQTGSGNANDLVSLRSVEIRNFNNDFISKFELQKYQTSYIGSQALTSRYQNRRLLDSVIQKDSTNAQQIYYFNYKNTIPEWLNNEDYVVRADRFGFFNMYLNCDLSYIDMNSYNSNLDTNPEHCLQDVLQSIILPSGGTQIFDFESNTFSYEIPNSIIQHKPEIYSYNVRDNIQVNDLHQFNFNTNTATDYYFTLNATGWYTFSFTNTPTSYPPNYTPSPGDPAQPIVNYQLFKMNSIGGNSILKFWEMPDDQWHDYTCLGQEVYLGETGQYFIRVIYNAPGGATGTINVKNKTVISNYKEHLYGGGVRIKQIAQFDKYVNADYFENPALYSNEVPVSHKKYSYQKFNNTNESSGFIVNASVFNNSNECEGSVVNYTNVTVTDSPSLGKKCYTFEKPITNLFNAAEWELFDAKKKGILLNEKIYDKSNRLLADTNYAYQYAILDPFPISTFCSTQYITEGFQPVVTGAEMIYTKHSWAKLTQKNSKNYFYDANGTPRMMEVQENYDYNMTNRQISEKTIQNLTDPSSSQLKTKYYYHSGNSNLSQNRISEIEKIETYRNNDLLSTSQLTYSNLWIFNNVSFLPNQLKSSKSNLPLENRHSITNYDEYSNPTEIINENGLTTTYLWGYQKSLPIAKIVNASNTQIASALGISSVNGLTEANLTTIDNLRNNTGFSNAFITTYTYKPLVGMLTVTDPKNDKISYVYDSFNRLKETRDKDNNLISENLYEVNQSYALNAITSIVYKTNSTTSLPLTSDDVVVTKAYFDGLGRTVQKIDYRQSATGKDIVTPFAYDDLTKIHPKTYLPFATSGNSLNYNPNALSDQVNFSKYIGQVAYSEQLLEESPVGSVVKQAAPGNTWAKGNGKEIKFEYLLNSSNDQVKRFSVTLFNSATNTFDIQFGLTGNSYYAENTLIKTVTKNENWISGDLNTTIEFKDSEGKLILKRSFNQTSLSNATPTPLDTYYVYDTYGNLTYVIPPLAEGSITGNIIEDLCYQYKYDYRNRLIEKKLPGKRWEFIVYDKIDRIVATGPTLSPFSDNAGTSGWLISKYDILNRVLYTGWTSATIDSAARLSLQNNQNSATVINESKTATNTTIDAVTTRYTNAVSPTSNFKLLTINYYDDYNFPGAPTTFTTVLDDNSQAVYFNNSSIKPKGMTTGVWSRINEFTTTSPVKSLSSYILYDRYSRIVRNYKTNYLGGYTQVDQKLDFTGKVLYTETKHKRINTATEILIREDFDYTPQSRLLRHKHKINNNPTQLLVKYEYDELGEVITKRVGGTDMNNGLQVIDYQYNIRGWLTQINDLTNLSKGTDPRDLFAFKLNYDSVENSVNGKVTPLYNGNISETFWKTNSDGNTRKYGYQYDALNRLNEAIYQRPGTTPELRNSYNEKITYDKNGNILTLERNGDMDDDINVVTIDQLNYVYQNNGLSNKLIKVTDATNLTSGFKDDSNGTNDTSDDYNYDLYGNQIKDENKGITLIKYNHLNLPIEITFTGTNKKINYLYDASGIKQQKIVTNGSSVNTTDYLDCFQYLKSGTSAVVLQFFPHAEGYVSNTVVNNADVYNYVFNYQDHLGNNRVSYTWNAQTSSLTILEENHYYPFGLKHNNYNLDQEYFVATGGGAGIRTQVSPYKYKYNGKEYQEELGLNLYDYGARNYDAAIGRWMNIDPKADKYSSLTPFDYVGANPLIRKDPDGMDWYTDHDGNYHYDSRLNKDNAEQFFKDNNILDGTYKFATGNIRVGFNIGKEDEEIISNYTLNQDGSITDNINNRNLNIFETQSLGDTGKTIKSYAGETEMEQLDREVSEMNSISRFLFNFFCYGDVSQTMAFVDLMRQNQAEGVSYGMYLTSQEGFISTAKVGANVKVGGNNLSQNSSSPGTASTQTTMGGSQSPNVPTQTVTVSGVIRNVHTGPEGGKYYINSNGNRVYLNRDGTKR